MTRLILLILGLLLLIFQQYILAIPASTQFMVFLIGIILLGVPHGAADMLVATKNAETNKKSFSAILFFVNYLGRLALFGLILWFFPVTGNLLFILFAAYHFGETDLYQFNTKGLSGKIFVITYGLTILGVILLPHFEEVKPLIQLFDSGKALNGFINRIDVNRSIILSITLVCFFVSTFVYFSFNKDYVQMEGIYIVQFALLVVILYNLPMLLGFSFYFIVWHAILSLKNITGYLRKDSILTNTRIFKQILFYSGLALGGLSLFGFAGFMFINSNTMMVYIFLGLAVLTAPHLPIMHDMYNSLRAHQQKKSNH